MRLHRVKLDPAMRSLGDTYARKEFRLHAKPQAHRCTWHMGHIMTWRLVVERFRDFQVRLMCSFQLELEREYVTYTFDGFLMLSWTDKLFLIFWNRCRRPTSKCF